MSRTAVVVGASIGGVRTAQALRSKGFDGRILLVGAEDRAPYDKPPLSKQYLAGQWTAERVSLLTESAAASSGIELRLGHPATQLDPSGRRIALSDGTQIPYDVCVVATGAAARPAPWVVQSGLHTLRSLADSDGLRADLASRGPVVVVGGGFVGAEVAATAHALGCAVTVVDPLPVPAARVLGPEVGALFGAVHDRHGVATRFGIGVDSVTGRCGDLTVRLSDGGALPAATVVVGIGAVPNDAWLGSSGLLVDDGVVCDEFCAAEGTTNVWAVGDVARWWHRGHGRHVRVEHWTNAVDQAAVVAHNVLNPGQRQPYVPVEYVWSDQYDWRIQILGRPSAAAVHRLFGDPAPDPPRAAALYGDSAGRLIGAAVLNWPRALIEGRRWLAAGVGFAEASDGLAGHASGRAARTFGSPR